jgi:hypothetical protein
MGSYYGYTPTLIHAGVGSIIARGAEVVANITIEGTKAIAGMKIEGAKSRAGIIMSSAASQAASLIEGAKIRLDYSKFQQQLAENKRQFDKDLAYRYASLNRSSGGGSRSSGSPVSRSSESPVSGGGVRGGGGLDGTNFVSPDDSYPSDVAVVKPPTKNPGGNDRKDDVPGKGTGYITREDGSGVYIDDTTRATKERIGTFTADNAPEGASPAPTQDNTFVGPLQPDETTPN